MKLNQLKQQRLRKVIDTGYDEKIEIYNVTEENEKEINKIIAKFIDVKTKELNIDGKTVILELMPLLSNIDLGYDLTKEEDQKIIEDIINHPSDTLLIVIREISTMIKQRLEIFTSNLDEFNKLPKDEIQKLIETKKEEISEVLNEGEDNIEETNNKRTEEEILIEIELLEKKLALAKSKGKING